MRALYLTVVRKFKPGDLPPKGYIDWHEWARIQRQGGIKQTQCSCGKWITPQEKPQHEHAA